MEKETTHSQTNIPGSEEREDRYKSISALRKSKHNDATKESNDQQEDATSPSRIRPFINMYDPFG